MTLTDTAHREVYFEDHIFNYLTAEATLSDSLLTAARSSMHSHVAHGNEKRYSKETTPPSWFPCAAWGPSLDRATVS